MQTQLIKQLNSSSEDLFCGNVTNNKRIGKMFLENIRQNSFLKYVLALKRAVFFGGHELFPLIPLLVQN